MATKEMVIDIAPTGKTEGMHFDKFSLGFLGQMTIGRASEIMFNEQEQNWEIVLPGETEAVVEATGFDEYDEARSFEVDWLQECRKRGVHPTSQKGKAIAANIRVSAILQSIAKS